MNGLDKGLALLLQKSGCIGLIICMTPGSEPTKIVANEITFGM